MEANGAVSISDLACFVTEGKEHMENNMLALKASVQKWLHHFHTQSVGWSKNNVSINGTGTQSFHKGGEQVLCTLYDLAQ